MLRYIQHCDDCGDAFEHGTETTCRSCVVWNSMFVYKNKGRNSGILSFRSGNHYIQILFHDWSLYRYTTKSAGHDTIKEMQALARSGQGLNSYIYRKKPDYVYKEKL